MCVSFECHIKTVALIPLQTQSNEFVVTVNFVITLICLIIFFWTSPFNLICCDRWISNLNVKFNAASLEFDLAVVTVLDSIFWSLAVIVLAQKDDGILVKMCPIFTHLNVILPAKTWIEWNRIVRLELVFILAGTFMHINIYNRWAHHCAVYYYQSTTFWAERKRRRRRKQPTEITIACVFGHRRDTHTHTHFVLLIRIQKHVTTTTTHSQYSHIHTWFGLFCCHYSIVVLSRKHSVKWHCHFKNHRWSSLFGFGIPVCVCAFVCH